MTDPTPPPERPLPQGSRDRMRADLLAHAESRPRAPRWGVPLVSATAVALVVGSAYWAVTLAGDEGPGPVTGDRTAQASVSPSDPAPSPVPSDEGTSAPIPPEPSGTVPAVTSECEEEMRFVLRNAELAFRLDEQSSYWVKGDQFVLCDQHGGLTTIHRPLPLVSRDGVATYAVSSVYESPRQAVRVAGGVVPEGMAGVFDVAYTFDDGHTERATQATDQEGRTWWRMVYAYDTGGGNELQKPPIEVTVSYSGVQKAYTLRWALDTCAQANPRLLTAGATSPGTGPSPCAPTVTPQAG
jgi:hypothetical protein